MGASEPRDPARGVDFPADSQGTVSTTAVGRRACATAAGAVDKKLAAKIAAVSNWRSGYLKPFRYLTEAAAVSYDSAVALSAAGLDYLYDTIEFTRDGVSVPIRQLPSVESPALRTVEVAGSQQPVRELVVPFEGKRLAGDDLRRTLEDWVTRGTVEPGFAEAVMLVADNPEWLDTSDVAVVVLGVGAEMGPAFSLLRWGGRVVGVDLPNPAIWKRLVASARDSAGTLEVPVPVSTSATATDEEIVQAAGTDLIARTPEVLDLLRSIDLSVSLAPTRIALFGYAHVPWFKSHQRMIKEAMLPGVTERLEMAEAAAERLKSLGYEMIGIDHFARQDDALAVAARNGTLRRNFQGYTSDPADVVIGLGASSISSFPQGFAQNSPATAEWARAVDAGRFATVRGVATTREDRMRAALIEALMCRLQVDVAAVARQHGFDPSALGDWRQRIDGLVNDGLATRNGDLVTVTEDARAFARIVASVFDAYLAVEGRKH